MKTVKLVESFISWQGEIFCGKRMLFLRFKDCNKECSFCDTQIKMRNTLDSEYSIDDIQDRIIKEKVGIVCTGGEPTLSKYLDKTSYLLNHLKYPYANIETNGFQLLELIQSVKKSKQSLIKYIYSPKIFNDKELKDEIKRTIELSKFENVYFKIVLSNRYLFSHNFKYLDEILINNNLDINSRVYLMPEGTTKEEVIRNSSFVFNMCERYKINFSSRDHIIFNFF